MLASSLAGGIGLVAVLVSALLVGGVAVGAVVSWWRRRHDEPLFAGMDDLVPLELVEALDDFDDAWSLPTPDDAQTELERLGAAYPADVRPTRSRRTVAGTGVLVALTVGALADRKSGRTRG